MAGGEIIIVSQEVVKVYSTSSSDFSWAIVTTYIQR